VAALAGAGSTRRTIFTHRGAAARRPLAYSVLKNLLACLGTVATTHYRRVSTGQHKDARISKGTALGAVLAEAPANQCVIGVLVEIRRASR